MTQEEMAKAYADGYNKEYQQIAYDAFLCGYGAKCDSAIQGGLKEAAAEYGFKQFCNRCEGKKWTTSREDFIAGAEWMKAKMMEKAVEGIAHPDDCEIWVNLTGYGYKFKDGDKVRVIIVKEKKK